MHQLRARFAARLYLPPGVRLPGIRGVLIRHSGLTVRAAEIEFAETRVAELYTHLAAARPRFDALRDVLRPGA